MPASNFNHTDGSRVRENLGLQIQYPIIQEWQSCIGKVGKRCAMQTRANLVDSLSTGNFILKIKGHWDTAD